MYQVNQVWRVTTISKKFFVNVMIINYLLLFYFVYIVCKVLLFCTTAQKSHFKHQIKVEIYAFCDKFMISASFSSRFGASCAQEYIKYQVECVGEFRER